MRDAAILGVTDPQADLSNAIDHGGWCITEVGRNGCDQILALYGVLGNRLWFVNTDGLDKHGYWMAKNSKRELLRLTAGLEHVWNLVPLNDKKRLKWIEHLGFTVTPLDASRALFTQELPSASYTSIK